MGSFSVQDAEYEAAGAQIVRAKDAFGADIVLKIRPPHLTKEVPAFKDGGHLISYIQPAINKELVRKLAAKKMTVIGATSPLIHNCLYSSRCRTFSHRILSQAVQ
jgi:NAD(P) transhydrogenase subunit alpha